MKYVLIGVLTFIWVDAFTQSDSLLWMSIARLKRATNDGSMKDIRGIEKKTLQLLRKRESATSTEESIEIVYSYWSVLKKVTNQQLRKEMVEKITNACKTDSSAKCYRAFAALRSMRIKDFSNESKQNIYYKALASRFQDDNTTLLVGFLNIREAYADLKKMVNSSDATWDIKVALARMGDENQIQDCLSEIPRVSERLNLIMLHKMAYIKQPQLIGVYNDYLQSDKAIPDSYDVRGIDYASLGANYLARLLEDFPLSAKITRYTPGQIALARQWMLANKGKYKIRRDEF